MSMATRTDTQSPALHVADSHDLIRVHGARVNNLKDVSVEIPKRRLTVFTGVSGSGKSSLVFGTIAAESQRLINETYSAFVQGFMPTLARPEVDVLEGLTTAIIVDQQRMGADPRSTVGTATDANAMLRILFSRLGQPHIGSPNAFSFNVASVSGAGAVTLERGGQDGEGAAQLQHHRRHVPALRGPGHGLRHRPDPALRRHQVAQRGRAHRSPATRAGGWNCRLYSASGFFDPDKPIRKYTKKSCTTSYITSTRTSRSASHQEGAARLPPRAGQDEDRGINMTYEGLIPRIQKSMLSKDKEAMQPHIRAFVERAVTFTACPECGGTRLSEAARSSKDQGDQHRRGVRDADQRPGRVGRAASTSRRWRRCSPRCRQTLDSFAEIGLGYLVARPAVGHAVGRRGAARQDDPPARLLAHRRHLRLRRADDRAAPP